jgi:1-acyl-sn-glycerol-3-phosphate acyltransferase
MKQIARFFQYIYNIYACLLFICCVLILVPFLLISLALGRLNGGNFLNICVKGALDIWFTGVAIFRKRLPGHEPDCKRQYIFVANHISYLDALLLFHMVRQKKRILAKIEPSKVPVFGAIYRLATVMVDRSSPEARARSVNKLKAFLRKDISIVLFPEGTFNMTDEPLKDFYDGAFRIAIETQTPVKPFIFLDTYDRMYYKGLFTLQPGRCRMEFLPAVEVEGLTLADVGALKQTVFDLMDNALREHKVSWVK